MKTKLKTKMEPMMETKTMLNSTFLKRSMLSAAIAVAPMSAQAFDYNFAQAGYVDTDFGNESGLNFEGSYDVHENTALIGSFTKAGDLTGFSVGGAYRIDQDFGGSLELHASFQSWEYKNTECNDSFIFFEPICATAEVDDSGLAFGGLYRHQMNDQLELFGDATYTTIFDGDFELTGGVLYNFAENLHVIGSYTLADADVLQIGVRYTLGE